MHQEDSIDTALDQSRNVIAVQARLAATAADSGISRADREILRRLAGEVAGLTARPIEAEKRELWAKHNALKPTRPLIFCDPENGWNEIITIDQIQCENPLARQWEMYLRKEVFWGAEMKDDYTVQPYFDVPHVHDEISWGLKGTRIGGEDGGALTWKSPISSEEDVDKLRYPEIRVDYPATWPARGSRRSRQEWTPSPSPLLTNATARWPPGSASRTAVQWRSASLSSHE